MSKKHYSAVWQSRKEGRLVKKLRRVVMTSGFVTSVQKPLQPGSAPNAPDKKRKYCLVLWKAGARKEPFPTKYTVLCLRCRNKIFGGAGILSVYSQMTGRMKLSQNWRETVNRATEGRDILRVARTLYVRVAKRQEARVENIL